MEDKRSKAPPEALAVLDGMATELVTLLNIQRLGMRGYCDEHLVDLSNRVWSIIEFMIAIWPLFSPHIRREVLSFAIALDIEISRRRFPVENEAY
jgi:hypothetical protein